MEQATNSERRVHARRILYSPEYLDMGADNGGVAVNLSEGGLGFQTVIPVTPDAQLPVSFSLGNGYRIDLKARVAWVNEEGKIGGAAFTKLSKDSLSLIREWVRQETENDIDQTRYQIDDQTDDQANGKSDAAAQAEKNAHLDSAPVKAVEAPKPAAIATENAFPSGESLAAEPEARGEKISVQNGDALPSAAAKTTKEAPELRSTPQSPAISETARTATPHGSMSSSAVPSISLWSRNDASATASPAPQKQSRMLPPSRGENIFVRPSARLEPSRASKGYLALIEVAIVIAAAATGVFYVRTHRQQVGDAIVRIGNAVAGASANAKPSQAVADASPATATPTQANTASAQNAATAKPQSPAAQDPASQANVPQPISTGTPQSPAQPTQTTAAPKQAAPNQVGRPSSSSSANPSTVTSSVSTPANSQGRVSAPHGNQFGAAATANKASLHTFSTQTIPHSAPATRKIPNAGASSAASPLSGQSQYQRAEHYLNGTGVTQDYSQAAQWFWRSLESGNTKAAVPLADLYLEGNGVVRSCTQARVLLNAAAKKNNAQAIQKLAQLPENCQQE